MPRNVASYHSLLKVVKLFAFSLAELRSSVGGFNRLFSLTMDNGKEVVVRMPFKNAGPRTLLIQSEVATMDFLRTKLGFPIPKVLAWNASPNNPVGCEYMIMEQCSGEMLANRVDSPSQVSMFAAEIAKMQTRLASIKFSQYGSIYYKENVSPKLQARPLYAKGEPEDECSKRFRIGLSVDRRFYRSERAHMQIDRGPCKMPFTLQVKIECSTHLGVNIKSYIRACAACEIDWITKFHDSESARNQIGARHGHERHLSLLRNWVSLSPAILPLAKLCRPSISHPDFHAANVFVSTDSNTPSVTGVIDWQNSTVRPLFETVLPSFFDVFDVSVTDVPHITVTGDFEDPLMPSNIDELDENNIDENNTDEIQNVIDKYLLMRQYLTLVKDINPNLITAMKFEHMEHLRRALYYSSYSWSDGLPLLEQILMQICSSYGKEIPVHKNFPTCPISFTKEERERHQKEFKTVIHREALLEELVHKLMKNAGIMLHRDGSVPKDQYEQAKQELPGIFARITAKCTPEQIEETKRLWPLREGKFDTSAESCV
jgi:hypothetical protein